MADAVHSTPAPIIPFPLDRARAPDQLHRAIDDWSRCRNMACMAAMFRWMSPDDAAEMLREIVDESGAGAVTKLIDETQLAIGSMRKILDELVAIDSIISAAADRVLAEAGA